MNRFSAVIVLLLTGGLLVSAGCLSTASPESSGHAVSTGAGSSGPVPDVTTVAPLPAIPAGALSLGDSATFNPAGTDEGKLTVVQVQSVGRVRVEEYLLGESLFQRHPENREPVPGPFRQDDQPGTKPVLAPSPASFIIHENGSYTGIPQQVTPPSS